MSPPFEILRPLGKGAMGSVHEVRVKGDPRRLVAKVLTSISPNARERFKREGELVARLDGHPGIVSVHSHGTLEDGTAYLLFDLVEGTTLFQLLRQAGLLPLNRVIQIGRELSAALAHAHANGIVHRDVKPENILIDEHGRVRLTDFGLGLAADQLRLTGSGVAVGTPLYMAPEQVRGKQGRVGPWTDVHAVGLVLAECLRGVAVFHGGSSRELAANVVSEVPPPLRIAPGIDAVVRRCLEKRAEDRYPHAGELAKDLERLALGQPPEALSNSRARTWLLLAIAVCVLLGVSLLAIGLAKRSDTSTHASANAAELLLQGEALLSQATELLSEGAVAGAPNSAHAVRLTLESADEQNPSPKLKLLIARHMALEAEVALLTGDLPAVPKLLAGANLGEQASEDDACHLASLEAGYACLAPQDGDDPAPHVAALARASERWPQRQHFHAWRAQLAVRAQAHRDAVDALQNLGDPTRVPVAVRFAAYLGTGDLEHAEELAADISEPALLGQLYYRLSLQALASTDLSPAHEHVRRALRDAPGDPLREEVLAKVRVLVAERGDWDPDSFGVSERSRLLCWEVDARLLLKQLDPSQSLSESRSNQLEDSCKQLLQQRGVEGLDVVAGLVALNPRFEPFQQDYLRVATQNGHPKPEQTLEVLALAYAHATGARRSALTLRYAMALRTLERLEPFAGIAERAERDQESKGTQCVVHSVWGDTLRGLGRTEEARETLKKAIELDGRASWPNSHMFRLCRDEGQPGQALSYAWRFLELHEKQRLALSRRENERVQEAVAWIEGRGDVADTVRALRLLTTIKRDAIHAASRCARALCKRRGATPQDLDRVAECIAARTERVRRYAVRSRLDPAETAPMLARLERFRKDLTGPLRDQLEVGKFEAVEAALLKLETALPKN